MAAPQVKVITQETFDSVVQENIDDFEMEPDEALKDTIDQFEKQKVSLSMIIKSVANEDGDHHVLCLTKQLSKLMDNKEATNDDVRKLMEELRVEFDKGISYRYQASKTAQAGEFVFKACVQNKEDADTFTVCLKTFASLITGQPDLVSSDGIKFILSLVEDCKHLDHAFLYLRILKLACTACENNRAVVVENKGIESILKCSEKYKDHCNVVKEACGALRSLTLDDDVRVAFGKAHDYTKEIVNTHHGLERIFVFIKDHEGNPKLASEVCLTLGKMMVRSEFCQQMVDMGGLEVIIRLLQTHMERPVLVRQCLGLIKAIGGNDEVKRVTCRSKALDLMITALGEHIDSPSICEAVFFAITTVSLRNPIHCDFIMSKGFAPLLIEAMERHKHHCGLQKQACRAIRNLVVRTRNHKTPFLELNAEKLIRKARTKHGKDLEDEGKAALRDLDLEVELRCPWTNTHKTLERD